ncbi:MAG: META domain-containing protein [Lewinellaceae bacterium]|nr:META domain-containing protein [Lewinellaceae bacterium]
MKQLLFFACAFFALALVQSCGSSSSIKFGKEWELVELNGEQLPAGVRIMIVFDEANKRYGGTASCNNYTGTFKLDGGLLKLSNPGVTKKACPDMTWEGKYLPILTKIDAWANMDGQLKLMSMGNTVAVYK